jgi:hypothetical protein
MTVYVADAYAYVQRLVSLVKMATMLEEYSTEEQRSVVRFFSFGQKDSMQKILIKMGNVYRIKRLEIEWINSLKDV